MLVFDVTLLAFGPMAPIQPPLDADGKVPDSAQ